MSALAVVDALTVSGRACLDCLAARARTTIVVADDVLAPIAQRAPRSLCRACGKIRMTYSLGGSSPSR